MQALIKFLFSTNTAGTFANFGLLLFRVFFGLTLATHGWQKLVNFSAMAESFPDPLGISSPLSLLCTILTELFAALLVAVGLFTRLAALSVIFSFAVVLLIVHAGAEFSAIELPLLYFFAFIAIFFTGSGRFGADAIFGKLILNFFAPKA